MTHSLANMKNHPWLVRTAVCAVVLALFFFMTVRVSPLTLSSVSIDHHVDLKQRNLKVDTAVCINFSPYVIQLAVAAPETQVPAQSDSPIVRTQTRYFTLPPPSSLA